MDEKKMFHTIEKLEKEIADLKGSKFKNRLHNFFSKSFTKVHWIIGIVIVVVASSLIVYATQITFTDGTVISANEVNSNFTELYDKTSNYSVRVYHDTGYSLLDNENKILTFNSESFDNGDFHSTTTNPERLTAPVDGIYLIHARIYFAAGPGQIPDYRRNLTITVNGTTEICNDFGFASENYFLDAMTIYQLSASDYVTVTMTQSSGATQNVAAGNDRNIEFSMLRLVSD
jgi:hypothetical protein